MKRSLPIILSAVIFSLANIFFAPEAHAGAWGESFGAATMKQMWEKIDAQIQGAIMGSLKQASAQMIDATVSGMISAGSAQASLFVSNWSDELFMGPKKSTGVFMNDFFTLSARGRISTKNYASCGAASLDNYYDSTNYWKYLTDRASSNIDLTIEIPEITLPGSICNPFDLFGGGGWGSFQNFASNPANNPTGYSLIAQNAATNYFEQSQMAKSNELIAGGGFKSQTKNGYVITPGSTLRDMQSNNLDLGNKILAGANSIPEIASSLATRVATQTIRQGIGNAQRNAQRQINQTLQIQQQRATQQIGPGSNGPGAQFRR